jgi:hypothetical protein
MERIKSETEQGLEKLAIWKTVKLGMLKSPDKYLEALKAQGIEIGLDADDLLSQMPCAQEETELDLVVTSLGQLGIMDGLYRYEAICDRAIQIGLKLCPAEVGPASRLIFAKQQRQHNELFIAMRFVLGLGPSRNLPFVFSLVGAQGLLHLGARIISDKRPFVGGNYGDRFVFVRPR